MLLISSRVQSERIFRLVTFGILANVDSSSEFECRCQIVNLRVACAERTQVPPSFDESENRRRVVNGVIDVMFLGERRHDDCRNPCPGSPTINLRRWNMVPPAAIFVVNNEDRRLGPVWAFAHQSHDLCYT